jgi:DNA-binding response OmpR family regulator
VVEDNDEVRGLLRATLERGGYRVVEAADGSEGSRAIASTAPALVLLDIDLPDMNGLDLCRQLRAAPATARLPIVIVSAAIGQTDRQAGLAAGADDYVTKPFSPRSLLARVDERLGTARASG